MMRNITIAVENMDYLRDGEKMQNVQNVNVKRKTTGGAEMSRNCASCHHLVTFTFLNPYCPIIDDERAEPTEYVCNQYKKKEEVG